jgi:hypothetical protein
LPGSREALQHERRYASLGKRIEYRQHFALDALGASSRMQQVSSEIRSHRRRCVDETVIDPSTEERTHACRVRGDGDGVGVVCTAWIDNNGDVAREYRSRYALDLPHGRHACFDGEIRPQMSGIARSIVTLEPLAELGQCCGFIDCVIGHDESCNCNCVTGMTNAQVHDPAVGDVVAAHLAGEGVSRNDEGILAETNFAEDDVAGLALEGARLELADATTPPETFQFVVLKRMLDVAIAVVGLLLAAPLIAVLAVLIKLDSPGPVFFTGDRLGLDGRRFRMYKLRTMRDGADAEKPLLAHLNSSAGPPAVQDSQRPTRHSLGPDDASLESRRVAPTVQRAEGRDVARWTTAVLR